MSYTDIRFAVLGAGRIGKIHAANLRHGIEGADVVALSDVSSEALAAVGGKLHVAQTFSDYRRVLDLPEVDAVVICTPTDTHYRMILDAAAAGKQIFCEKPLDLSIDRIQTIIDEVEKCGVKLMVGFNRRFDHNFLKVRDALVRGTVISPQVLRITSRDPAPPSEDYIRTSGGLFLDMTIHDFDMARFLIGEVEEVYARAGALVSSKIRELGDSDTAVVTLGFASGALGVIDNSRNAVYGYDQRLEVFGSGGMIAVGNDTPDSHVLLNWTGAHSALPLNFFMERYAESYRSEMRAFTDSIRGGKPVPVGGVDGLMAVVIALAANRSAKENRPVKVAEIYERRVSACRAD